MRAHRDDHDKRPETENRALRARVSALESELSFLRMHTAVLQGMKGKRWSPTLQAEN